MWMKKFGNICEFLYIMYGVLVLSMDINLQRKFVRLSDDDRSATYQVFRKWLGSTSINDET